MAVTKTHPIKSTLKAAIDYILNPEKTDGKLLASSFVCGLETADIEFAWTREAAGDRGTHLGRHLIQSFAVGETTPEEAHKIGMELAQAVLGGKYEFVLTTHVDKEHLHNHLIFNAVKITAWLEDDEGNIIAESPEDFNYDFVILNKPVSSLAEIDANGNPILYTSGTQYKLVNEYETSERNIKLFYTRDGSDPTDIAKRKEFITGDVFTLTSPETLRAVYMETIDGQSFFGPESKYIYALKTSSGGSGGGGGSGGRGGSGGNRVVDNTRKYTKDIFGNEHPTHVGYINGYPDGSVQPDGKITREEMAAILYRIKNKQYDEPFSVKGDVFPDVTVSRWSVSDIEYMAKYKVIEGYPDGEFKPSRNLTRAEFAALIRRFTGLEQSDVENIFPDLTNEHWAYEDIMALYGEGMLSGYEDGTIRPENEISRAEVMKVVNLLLGRNPSEPYVKSLDYNPFNDLETDKWYYVIVLEATVTHNYYLDDKGFEIKWEDCK